MGAGTSTLAAGLAKVKGNEVIPPTETSFWSLFWNYTANVDVYTAITADDIRYIKKNNPQNLASLVNQLVNVLSVNVQNAATRNFQVTHVNNAVRLLTRIMPYVFEDQSDDFADKVFWWNEAPNMPSSAFATTTTAAVTPTAAPTPASAPVPTEEPDHIGKGKAPATIAAAADPAPADPMPAEAAPPAVAAADEGAPAENQPLLQQGGVESIGLREIGPLAARLLSALQELMFTPSYTVAASLAATYNQDKGFVQPLSHIWAAGVQVEKVTPTVPYSLWSNRLTILRALLVCLSQDLYYTPEQFSRRVNKWVEFLACHETHNSQAVFLSLINTMCCYDPVGWGIPYNHLMMSDEHEATMNVAIQIINVLTHHNPIAVTQHHQLPPSTAAAAAAAADGSGEASAAASASTPTKVPYTHMKRNVFVEYLRSLTRGHDFAQLIGAFTRLVTSPVQAVLTRLPYSMKPLECYHDILILFWKLAQENPKFLEFSFKDESFPNFVVAVLHFIHEARKQPSLIGLLHLCSFVLLLLSGYRDFSVALSRPFVGRPTIDLPSFAGSYLDYLILVIQKVMVDGHSRIELLYDSLLTIFTNISPFVKNMAMVTCMRLMRLFEYLSRPKFLVATPYNFRYVALLLEGFNNIVQYQYEGNTRFIYSLLRCQNAFSKLAHLGIAPPTSNEHHQQTTEQVTASSETKLADAAAPDAVDVAAAPAVADAAVPAADAVPAAADAVAPAAAEAAAPAAAADAHVNADANAVVPGALPTNSNVATHFTSQAWIPTNEWITEWKSRLPFHNILTIITYMAPQISSMCTNSADDEEHILSYLQRTTLVGLLPAPHAIIVRKYHENEPTYLWACSYMWGVIYIRNLSPPLFSGTNIKLFGIKIAK